LPQPPPAHYSARLSKDGEWSGAEGRVALVRADGADGLPESWLDDELALRFRGGGERFQPRGRDHHHTLKHLFQENGIVPWMRARVPLVYRGAALVAVGDLWVTADVDAAPASEPRWRIEWSHDAPVRAPG
jgi:tRNA(Ile)-lysidine synthase